MAQIRVNHLTFYYDGSFDDIFENVSFSIDTDWKLGFIGRNGKGKTTFLNLLMGKYEYNGSIETNTMFDYFPYQIADQQMQLLAAEFMVELKAGCEDWRVICELAGLGEGAEILYIGVTKQIRKQIGKSFGDIVEVVLQERDREKVPMWKCPKCGREFKKKEQSHFCGEKPKTIDEYILSQDEDKQEDLSYIRQILHSALPEAEERISWSMPTYWKEHNIIHFAASKKHIGLYPGPAAVVQFSKELQGYKTDKGTIRIPYGKVDAALIEKIAKWCLETGNHA